MLHIYRHQALTPLVAAAVCGGVIGVVWIVGFTIYFYKRYRRKVMNQQIREGKLPPDAKVEWEQKKKEKKMKRGGEMPDTEDILIPPDPAVLLGHKLPGEKVLFHEGKPLLPSDCPDNFISSTLPASSSSALIYSTRSPFLHAQCTIVPSPSRKADPSGSGIRSIQLQAPPPPIEEPQEQLPPSSQDSPHEDCITEAATAVTTT